MANFPTREQQRAMTTLQSIGWKWNYETLKKDIIRCWSVDERDLETKGFSINLKHNICEIHPDGAVKMGEATLV